MRDILLLVLVAGFTAAALFRPVVGIMFFAWLGFFSPQSYTWDLGRTLPLSQIAAIGTMVGYVFWHKRIKIPLLRETLLLLGLWLTFGISTIFAIYRDPATDYLIYVSKILLMVFLTISLIEDESSLRMLLRVIALSIGFYGLKGGFFAFTSGGGELVLGPEESFLFANNSIGLAMAMNIPLLYYLFRTETRQWLRWLIGAMMVFSYPAIICTYSRGAWLGAAMATAMLLLRIRHKFVVVAAAGILLAVLGGALTQILPQRLFARYDQFVNYEKDDSAESRFWNWEFCRRVGFARPLTGGGFQFPSLEVYAVYYPEFLDRWPDKQWTCHSAPLTILGEHGIISFVIWIFLIGCCFLSLRQVRRYGRVHPEASWMTVYADSIQASFVAFIVVGTFLDAAYFDMYYYLVAMVVIARAIVLARPAEVLSAYSAPVVAEPALARGALAMKKK